MAENDQNDDYKFVEFDSLDNSMMDEPNNSSGSETSAFAGSEDHSKKNIKRNAVIALGVIIFVLLMYKIIAGLFFHKKEDVAIKTTSSPPTQAITELSQPTQPSINTIQPSVPQSVITVDNSELNKKVTAIELSQENVRSEVGSVSQQVSSVNSNVQNLNNQIASLNQVINNLSTQLAKQTEEINVLMVRTQPKRIVKPVNTTASPSLVYYIQAVIPGRAWIIATNGSTLTVREGTKIAGYGTVQLIDPLQGRVVTSSGHVIRFSQEDS